MNEAPTGQDAVDARASTALEDPGTVQAYLFLGWIPPAVAAVVGGVIVAFVTGNVLALVGVAIGGTLVGYIAGLVVLFSLPDWVGERVANLLLVLVVAVSVAAALAVAVVASGVELDPVLAESVERTMKTLLGLLVILIIVVSLIVAIVRRLRS